MRVASNQVRALRAEGHDATLVAGHMGFKGNVPEEFDGIPVKLFRAYRLIPAWGFSGMVAPAMMIWLWKELRTADAVHIHMGRDLITLMSGLLSRIMRKRYVIQTHGMITPSKRVISKSLDFLVTNRIFGRASKIFFLTPNELTGLRRVGGDNLPFEPLINGVPSGSHKISPRTGKLDVLFLARLHPRKRPEVFATTASQLSSEFPDATFTISGPDEGSKSIIIDLMNILTPKDISGIQITDAIPAEIAVRRIEDCDIYVLPSLDEPFPMSVLEAMAAGVPVVVTESCGLAPYIVQSCAGLVVDSTQDGLTDAVRCLMQDERLRSRMGANGLELVQNEFSMLRVVSILADAYSKD